MKTAFKQLPRDVTVTDGGATFDEQADVFTVGAGYLDVQAALSNKDKAQGVAKSPTAAYDITSGNVYFVADVQTPWGQAAIGNPRLPISSTTWAAATVWGGDAFLPELSYVGELRHARKRTVLGQFSKVGELGHVGQFRYVGQLCHVGEFSHVGQRSPD